MQQKHTGARFGRGKEGCFEPDAVGGRQIDLPRRRREEARDASGEQDSRRQPGGAQAPTGAKVFHDYFRERKQQAVWATVSKTPASKSAPNVTARSVLAAAKELRPRAAASRASR
jgi:hypothetical protein